MIASLVVCFLSVASGFQLAAVRPIASRAASAQMLGGGGGEGGFMCASQASRPTAFICLLTRTSSSSAQGQNEGGSADVQPGGASLPHARVATSFPNALRRPCVQMMKKYSEVGVKVQALQEELAQTEIECATSDGGVVVKVTGTQVPLSVEVTQGLCDAGSEKAGAELTAALKQAHMKSGVYAQDRMKDMYEELGLAGGLAGMGGGPAA